MFEFFERHGVPDKEHIADSTSDLVWQQESNAEQIYRLAGEHATLNHVLEAALRL